MKIKDFVVFYNEEIEKSSEKFKKNYRNFG